MSFPCSVRAFGLYCLGYSCLNFSDQLRNNLLPSLRCMPGSVVSSGSSIAALGIYAVKVATPQEGSYSYCCFVKPSTNRLPKADPPTFFIFLLFSVASGISPETSIDVHTGSGKLEEAQYQLTSANFQTQRQYLVRSRPANRLCNRTSNFGKQETRRSGDATHELPPS